MTKREYDTLLRNIREIYTDFKGDTDLLDYRYEDIRKNFLQHKGTETPSYYDLIEGLKKENEKDMRIQCDLCKTWIPYTTWEEYDKHWRRCSKIDFINRQAKELGGKGIDYGLYREMEDEELERRYRQIMNNYEKSHSKQEILEMI